MFKFGFGALVGAALATFFTMHYMSSSPKANCTQAVLDAGKKGISDISGKVNEKVQEYAKDHK